jgi:hypothetical protein
LTGDEYLESLRDGREIRAYGERVEDVVADRDAIAEWARISYGWMGRSPGYKAAFLGTLGANSDFYEPYQENAKRWYQQAGRRRLADRWSVPLVGDESCISLAHVDRALEDGAVRAVSVKTARTGYTESRRILDLCLGRCTPVVVGSQYEGAIGAWATLAFGAAFAATANQPAELTNFLDLDDDLLVAAPEIREGRVEVTARPGLGVEVDEDKLSRYRLDR